VILIEVLGVGLWAVLGLAGAWWLVTGRKTIYGLPKGMKEGWPMRVMGLAYLLMAAFLVYQVFHGTFYADGVVFSYAFFAVALAVYLYQRRKGRIAGSAGAASLRSRNLKKP
jgi:hypothetical protein